MNHDENKLYFISFATVYWIDVFVRQEYMKLMIESWKHCQENKALQIYGWCIMTSHIHMIIGTTGKKLDEIVGEMKSCTSTQFKKNIKDHLQESRKEWMLWLMERAGKKNSNNSNWQFWQQHNQPIEIVNQKMYVETVWYIHQNPVVSGFVYEAEQWIYGSAKSYANNNGIIKLTE